MTAGCGGDSTIADGAARRPCQKDLRLDQSRDCDYEQEHRHEHEEEKTANAISPFRSRARLARLNRVGRRLDGAPAAEPAVCDVRERRTVLSISRLHSREPHRFTPERSARHPRAGGNERAFDQRRAFLHSLPALEQWERRSDLGDGREQNHRAGPASKPDSKIGEGGNRRARSRSRWHGPGRFEQLGHGEIFRARCRARRPCPIDPGRLPGGNDAGDRRGCFARGPGQFRQSFSERRLRQHSLQFIGGRRRSGKLRPGA